MYKLCLHIFLILIITSCSNQKTSGYPETKKEEFTETIHGYEISDSYRWLEDFTSDDSLDWVKRQNKFTKTFISKNNYKKDIANYLEQIWENESISIPYKEEGKTFYYFNDGSFQQSKLMIKDCDKCDERVLIDPNTFSDDGTISLGGTSVNNSADMIAFSISDGGSDWKTWKVINVSNKEVLKDEIKWTKFSNGEWESDNSGFYYQRYPKPEGDSLLEINKNPKLYFHEIGTSQAKDKLIYHEPSKPNWSFDMKVSEDSLYRVLSIGEGTDERNRVYIKYQDQKNFEHLISNLEATYIFIESKGN